MTIIFMFLCWIVIAMIIVNFIYKTDPVTETFVNQWIKFQNNNNLKYWGTEKNLQRINREFGKLQYSIDTDSLIDPKGRHFSPFATMTRKQYFEEFMLGEEE